MMTVIELTDSCHRFDVTKLTLAELTCHQYGLSVLSPIWLSPCGNPRMQISNIRTPLESSAGVTYSWLFHVGGRG